MIQLLEFIMFFAIVLFLMEHDRPRSGLHAADEIDDLATRRSRRDEARPSSEGPDERDPARS
jgi:hypothetical protein